MKGRAKSIMPCGENTDCYICGRSDWTELHHIFHGVAKRRISDQYGCVCYLCADHHRGTYGVHGKYGHELDTDLKKACQTAWESRYGDRDKFIEVFGRSYL